MGTAVGVGDAGGAAMVPVAPAGEGLGESPGKAWGVLMRVSDGYMPSAGVAAQADTGKISVLRVQCLHSGLLSLRLLPARPRSVHQTDQALSKPACLQWQPVLNMVRQHSPRFVRKSEGGWRTW